VGIQRLVNDFLDLVNTLPPILMFVPGQISPDPLESRTESITPDVTSTTFSFANASPLRFTDIEIYLIFDFTGTNVGVSLDENGPFVEKSMLSVSMSPAPLTIPFDVLQPLRSTPTQTVYMKSNLNGQTADQGNYQIGLTGKFKAEPVLEMPLPDFKPPALTGGLIWFGVVDD